MTDEHPHGLYTRVSIGFKDSTNTQMMLVFVLVNTAPSVKVPRLTYI